MSAVEKHVAAMNAANSLTDTAGVRQKGGKKYLEVKHRVTVLRQTYGLELGIETELLHACDKHVRVSAKITDATGRVIGSGLAEEVRGSSNVNSTSALENAETSAVGRALASLGLHGGEYASLNEIEIAQSHRTPPPPAEPPPAEPVPTKVVADEIPFDSTDARVVEDWPHWCAVAKAKFSELQTESRLRGWMTDNERTLQKLKAAEPKMFADLGAQWWALVEDASTGDHT